MSKTIDLMQFQINAVFLGVIMYVIESKESSKACTCNDDLPQLVSEHDYKEPNSDKKYNLPRFQDET